MVGLRWWLVSVSASFSFFFVLFWVDIWLMVAVRLLLGWGLFLADLDSWCILVVLVLYFFISEQVIFFFSAGSDLICMDLPWLGLWFKDLALFLNEGYVLVLFLIWF